MAPLATVPAARTAAPLMQGTMAPYDASSNAEFHRNRRRSYTGRRNWGPLVPIRWKPSIAGGAPAINRTVTSEHHGRGTCGFKTRGGRARGARGGRGGPARGRAESSLCSFLLLDRLHRSVDGVVSALARAARSQAVHRGSARCPQTHNPFWTYFQSLSLYPISLGHQSHISPPPRRSARLRTPQPTTVRAVGEEAGDALV